MKIYIATFNDGSFYASGLPEVFVVADSIKSAKDRALEIRPTFNTSEIWVSELKIDGYVIEVYDEKLYNRHVILEKLLYPNSDK